MLTTSLPLCLVLLHFCASSLELENAAAEPRISVVEENKERVLLHCHVSDASPKPTVKWQDGAGNVLHAEEPQVSEVKGRFNVTLLTTVTSSGHYRCVVTQEEINHLVYSEIYVYFRDEAHCPSISTIVLSALAALSVALVVVCVVKRCRQKEKRS